MRIALLEDDIIMQELMSQWLTDAGYDILSFSTATEFMRILSRESFDICLLDSNLPDMQGQEVLRWMRNDRLDSTPVMFVTARDSEEDIVGTLQIGADDYLIKPPRQAELLARIDAVLRRTQPFSEDNNLEIGPYQFDLHGKQLTFAENNVELTEKEFDLALFLFRNLGRLVSRGHLLTAVWGRNPAVATRTVDTHISRVRTKLQLRPENGFRLSPAYNYGYRLERISGEIN